MANPKTDKTNVSTLVQGLIQVGTMDEDREGTPFMWGTLISTNPCDEQGNSVSNPGSFMIYSAKGLKTGDMEEVVLLKRGIAGLYNLVQASDISKVLTKLKLDIADIPEIPVIQSESTMMDRKEASLRSRKERKTRRDKVRNNELLSLEATVTPHQEAIEEELV